MDKLGKFFGAALLDIPFILLGAIILQDLWGWFIVTTFELEPIRWFQAAGLNIFVAWFVIRVPRQDQPSQDLLYLGITRLFAMLIMWGFGALIYFFLF